MFYQYASARKLFVFPLLLWRKRVIFALFVRCARVLVVFINALVATVGQTTGGFKQRQTALFEESKVVGFAQTKSRAKQTLVLGSHNQLRFARVALFLAAVATALFFWGRSMGVSVASTITT